MADLNISGDIQISPTSLTGSLHPTTINLSGDLDTGNGKDGYSPTVDVEVITGGHRITITDRDGAHTFDVVDGTVGVGISDISKTSTHDAEDTYTITYTDGSTTTFVVTNGEVTWNDVGNIAVVSHTQPSSSHNVIWIEDEGTTIELPTMEDLEEVADDVDDLKADINNKADIIFSNTSGAIASFTDGADGLPMESVVAYIEPVQSGTGDPSPDNIRPISGRSEVSVTRTRANLYSRDLAEYNVPAYATDGTMASYQDVAVLWIKVKPNTTYSTKCVITTTQPVYIRWINCDANKGFISRPGPTYPQNNLPSTFTTPANCYWVQIAINQYPLNAIAQNNWTMYINEGSTLKEEPSNGQTITVQLGQTVYGGTVDVTQGKLTVTDANIASYNGETLPSTWISDRDVYAEGTTPTTGAQVVYKLATPITYDLTPQEITSLLGVNNVWSDTGDTDVTYRADTKLYLESHAPKVDDVQVGGTSVVNQGVANVPIGNVSDPGVYKVSTTYGVNVTSGSVLVIARAGDSDTKTGTNNYKPIVPVNQHISTFYGLAKAASDTTQSQSSNAVGTYTDAAKVAIQKMLGIYEPPYELLNDITLESESEINLTADSNGTPYNLLGVYIYIYYVANLETASGGYGRYRCYDSRERYCSAETGKYTTAANAKFKLVFLDRRNNLAFFNYTTQATTGGNSAWDIKYPGVGTIDGTNGGSALNFGNIVRIATPTGDVEPAGTRIQVYGQRAY